MPLRLRLAALFALATALAILASGAAFLHELHGSLDAALDPGLRSRMEASMEELSSDGVLPTFGPAEQLTVVRKLDGTPVSATPNSTGLELTAEQQRQALAGEVSFTTRIGTQRARVLASTSTLHEERMLVVVGTPTDVSDIAVDRVEDALMLAGPPAVLLAGAGAWLLAGAALRPVERMRREAAAISEHELDRRLAVPTSRDEIAALGRTINQLLGRLQHALERERRFVADAGHELRTPLAILRTELELAARPGRSPAALREAIGDAGHETDRLIRLAQDLLLLARADNRQPILRVATVRLDTLLADAAGRRDREHPVEVRCPSELEVSADPDRLRQALDNLLDNAIRHSPADRPVRLSAGRGPDGSVLIEVLDHGTGLSPEFLPMAFERFQRAENGRSRDTGGTGLGLSIVRAIAEAHGGSARLDNRADGGAHATLRLPARRASDELRA